MRRRDRRPVLLLATIAALALIGLLIEMSGTVGTGQPQLADKMSDGESREVHETFQQAVAMLHAKHYEFAVQSLHEVLAIRPRMPEAHVNMGFALFGLGNYSAARDFFAGAAAIRPAQYNAYYGLAVANEALGELAAAAAAMKTFVHLAPADDPFRRKAESAVWEWESALEGQKP